MKEEPLMEIDWLRLILRWVMLACIWISGYFSFQAAKDESLVHWLRLVLVYYSLFTALLGIWVLGVIVWKLSRIFGIRYDWWMFP